MVFFYELLFVLVAVVAVFIGETWSRFGAFVFVSAWFIAVLIGYLSFGARLATANGLTDADRRWFSEARDGMRHLRLLFGLAAAAALVWRLIAG